ncbi:hypothetical protein HOT31_gp089 [Microbacterium phage Hendrix]|uniref:Uncharacterized protein n=1 Tax=Microbacterium phage Hendrix TaxID=2182341 RepID=A0A2U8UUB5_9CAUD|nr:hypothetical protein HOT31_gp089 [Microbacterium phage Hendrix]AWN07760.1 hypothetical protein PBI_HENDRIX_89 [Microbacterium phage Hendrix]
MMDADEYQRRLEEMRRKHAAQREAMARRHQEEKVDQAVDEALETQTPLELLLLTDVALFFSFSIIIKLLRDFPRPDDNNL